MKKLILILAFVLLPLIASADIISSPIIDIINSHWKDFVVNEGGIYCVREHQFKELTSLTVAKFQAPKWSWLRADFDIGYAPSDMLALELMYPLGNLSQFHITIPIVSSIDINVGYGWGWLFNDDSRKTDGGPAITGSVKW
jgi:hypothetical protein